MTDDNLRDEVESLRERVAALEAHLDINQGPSLDEASVAGAVKDFIARHEGYDRGVTHDVLVSDVAQTQDVDEEQVEMALTRLQEDGEIYSVEQNGSDRWKVS